MTSGAGLRRRPPAAPAMIDAVRPTLLSLVLLAPLLAAGCGDGPTPQPGVGRPALDPSGEPIELAGGGSIDMPASWKITTGPQGGPELARATSGQGAIVVWRYARTEPLPTTTRDLREARHTLKLAARARDPKFRFTSGVLRRVPAPAIELAGIGTIAGAQRAIRSLHVYASGQETVVDCIGPLSDLGQYNETICGPVLRSLQL